MIEHITQWIGLGVFVATAALLVWRLWLEKTGADEMRLKRVDAVRGILTQLLQGSVFCLVTKAEQEFGPGCGALKKSAVLAELMRLLPEQWRTLYHRHELEALIESELPNAQKYWREQA